MDVEEESGISIVNMVDEAIERVMMGAGGGNNEVLETTNRNSFVGKDKGKKLFGRKRLMKIQILEQNRQIL